MREWKAKKIGQWTMMVSYDLEAGVARVSKVPQVSIIKFQVGQVLKWGQVIPVWHVSSFSGYRPPA